MKADLRAGRATVQRTQLNGWGVMHALHTFTGAPAADSRNRRDWTVTTVWALSMDAVAAGLIVMVLGSYVMWFRLTDQKDRRRRRPGARLRQLWSLRRCVALAALIATSS